MAKSSQYYGDGGAIYVLITNKNFLESKSRKYRLTVDGRQFVVHFVF